jgi:ABC-type glycerol-3-phosphate transport system substrate-binding protein
MKNSKPYLLLTAGLLLTLLLGSCAQATPVVESTEVVAPTQVVVPTSVESGGAEVVEAPTVESGGGEEVIELVYQRYIEGIDLELDFVDEFNASHPNIHVTVDSVPAVDAYQKVLLTTEAGTPPDIIMTHFTLSSATAGLAMDLTPLVEAEGPDWVDKYTPSGWVFHDYAGHHYAMPWRVSPTVVFLNNKLLEKAGLEVPPDDWTMDDFLAYAKAMTHPENDEYGFCLVGSADNTTTTLQFGAFLFSFGGKHIGDDGLSNLNSEPTIETLNFLNTLIHEAKVVPPGTASSVTNTCTDLLAADKVGMWTNADLWRGFLRTQYPDIDISVAPHPQKAQQAVWIGGTGLAISAKTKHPEAAWEFVKFLTSEDIMRRWSDEGHFMPPNKSLWEDPEYIAADPEREVVAKVLETYKMYPLDGYPEGYDLNAILRNYIQAVYIQDMTPEEAMAAAATEWDQRLVNYQQDNWWNAWMK